MDFWGEEIFFMIWLEIFVHDMIAFSSRKRWSNVGACMHVWGASKEIGMKGNKWSYGAWVGNGRCIKYVPFCFPSFWDVKFTCTKGVLYYMWALDEKEDEDWQINLLPIKENIVLYTFWRENIDDWSLFSLFSSWPKVVT